MAFSAIFTTFGSPAPLVGSPYEQNGVYLVLDAGTGLTHEAVYFTTDDPDKATSLKNAINAGDSGVPPYPRYDFSAVSVSSALGAPPALNRTGYFVVQNAGTDNNVWCSARDEGSAENMAGCMNRNYTG